jgi:DNA-binding LytR/AlgR family response regulator
MEMIRVLIADDEPLARELLESYLEKLPNYRLVASCANALEAFAVLSKEPVDLMLLDINMPEISGIDFLKTLKHPPKVIFTTAYAEFAVESYEHHAVDYLLKPITFSRFMMALQKLEGLMQPAEAVKPSLATEPILFVRSEGKMLRINPDELWMIEGYGNYVRLWSAEGKLIMHNTMKQMEAHFQQYPLFIRISKSYIVNLKFVSELDGNCLRVGTESLAIGATYRDEVKKVLDRYQLL